ncbi:MAG TPA: YchJ family protein [Gammaproteobacteria bacterium]|nr:YchJ family protein [Gammaproteobacteria bacterium]
MSAPDTNATCPCGSGLSYGQCCGRYIEGGENAPSAEALMRSRYTAFVHADAAHLLRTWHPSTRPAELALDDAAVRWLGLSIKRCERGGPDDHEGTVEFVARMKRGGRAARLHEVSRFTREDGQWFYVDGELREPRRR